MSVRSVRFLETSYVLVKIVASSKSEDLRGLKLCYKNILVLSFFFHFQK